MSSTRRDVWVVLAICLIAVGVRTAVIILSPSIHHPDEVFQYLEQAHRLRSGNGLVPWEYVVGARGWLLPGLLSGVMAAGGLFGEAPSAPLAGVAVLLCLMSLCGVVCGYWWGRRAAGFAGGVTAGLLNATWFELVHFSTHVLSETFAATALVAGLYLIYPYRSEPALSQRFLGALLLGLAVVFRLQLLPAVIIGILAVCGRRWRGGYDAILPALLLPLLLSGLLDWMTLGEPFQSISRSMYYNLMIGVSSRFGVQPFTAYVTSAATLYGPFAAVVAIATVLGGLRLPPLLCVALAAYLSHSVISHKEYRFISPVLPLIATMAAVGSVLVVHRLTSMIRHPLIRRGLLGTVPIAWIIASGTLAGRSPAAWFWVRDRGSLIAMRMINDDPAACGVGILPAGSWYLTGGYVHLRPGLPIYGLEAKAELAAANYVILYREGPSAESGWFDVPRADYTVRHCWTDPTGGPLRDKICLLRRPGRCDPTAGQPLVAPLPGYVSP